MSINHLTLGALAATFIASCATAPTAKLDITSSAVLTSMSDKLAAAKTLRVHVTRSATPGFTIGVPLAESASSTILVSRPDRLAARIDSSEGKIAIGIDGSKLTLVDYRAGTHGVVKAVGDIDAAVRSVEDIYGVTPPVAELLANHPLKLMLEGVKSGKHVGTEIIGGVKCDHLAFEQDRLSWQLWVAVGDKLPRKISLAYPNGEGGPPLTMTANMSKWELDVPLSSEALTVKAPSGSRELEMIPLQP